MPNVQASDYAAAMVIWSAAFYNQAVGVNAASYIVRVHVLHILADPKDARLPVI
jgi:hypothetical protein